MRHSDEEYETALTQVYTLQAMDLPVPEHLNSVVDDYLLDYPDEDDMETSG